MTLHVLLGDCVERVAQMSSCSVDAVLCDPPYDLVGLSRGGSSQPGDMATPYGRTGPSKARGIRDEEWDGTGIAFQQETWAGVYRVLRSGGQVKAFGGTRTYHKMARAMESAGFTGVGLEAWSYATGFPKSHSVGRGIDRQWGRLTTNPSDVPVRDTAHAVTALKKELRRIYDTSGKSRKQVDEECGFRACNYLSHPEEGKRPDPWFYVLPSPGKWEIIKRVLGVEEELTFTGAKEEQRAIKHRLDDFFREAVREVVGYRKCVPGLAFSSEGPSELPMTIPATEEAAQWEGWGTALKPAWEPVLVGYKEP